MKETEIKIMKYLYERGIDEEKGQGYEQGVFYQTYFDVDEMKNILQVPDSQLEESIETLLNNHYIDFVKSKIGLNEIGWATYIDGYYHR